MSLIYDRPTGLPADTVAAVGRRGDTAITLTCFHLDGIGVAIGARDLNTEAVMVAVFTPEDTELLRQQLNIWFGPKANLVEVKNG